MEPRPFRTNSTWFAAMIALLVALGTQVLLDSIVPASFTQLQFGTPDTIVVPRTGAAPWVTDAAIRFLSFALGGFVAVLLAEVLSRWLFAALLLLAVLATIFQQLPSHGPATWLVLWSLVAPMAIALGAWVASAKRSAA
jgi:hypothetical protein